MIGSPYLAFMVSVIVNGQFNKSSAACRFIAKGFLPKTTLQPFWEVKGEHHFSATIDLVAFPKVEDFNSTRIVSVTNQIDLSCTVRATMRRPIRKPQSRSVPVELLVMMLDEERVSCLF